MWDRNFTLFKKFFAFAVSLLHKPHVLAPCNPMWICPQRSHATLGFKQHSRRVLTDGRACSRHTVQPFRNTRASNGIPAQDLEDAPARTVTVPERTHRTHLRDVTRYHFQLNLIICNRPEQLRWTMSRKSVGIMDWNVAHRVNFESPAEARNLKGRAVNGVSSLPQGTANTQTRTDKRKHVDTSPFTEFWRLSGPFSKSMGLRRSTPRGWLSIEINWL